MKVTYLGHSGFLVETGLAYYLFDYIRGQLPAWKKGKPLYIFASHSHADHFNHLIFDRGLAERASAYVFGTDIIKRFKRSKSIENSPVQLYGEKIYSAQPGEEICLPDCHIMPVKSTDTGAAFLVTEGNMTLYHAGDLNWWHWDGDTKANNRNMEVNYKREIDNIAGYLKGQRINTAFVPLDPRLGEAYYYGMDYLFKTVETDTVFPMHFWEDYGIIDRYNREHGELHPVMKIEREGQEFTV